MNTTVPSRCMAQMSCPFRRHMWPICFPQVQGQVTDTHLNGVADPAGCFLRQRWHIGYNNCCAAAHHRLLAACPKLWTSSCLKTARGCNPPESQAELLASAGAPAGQRLPLGIHWPWFEPPVDAPKQKSSYEEGGHSCHLRASTNWLSSRLSNPFGFTGHITTDCSKVSMLLQHASLPLSTTT